MFERDGNGLPPELWDAARLLREAPAPNDLWRQRLLRDIEAAPPPRAAGEPPSRRWSLRPWVAIAAGLACALVGAGSAMVVVSRNMAVVAARPAMPRVRFALVAPTATHVSIVGDFNAWNPSVLPLRRAADGRTWEVEVPLAPGRYAYAFVVDGALARDPTAPQAKDDDFGSANSVVMVKGS